MSDSEGYWLYTLQKAKAARPHAEKLITLGKKGDLHSRRLALSYLQNRGSRLPPV
jgi:ribosomal protein L17